MKITSECKNTPRNHVYRVGVATDPSTQTWGLNFTSWPYSARTSTPGKTHGASCMRGLVGRSAAGGWT